MTATNSSYHDEKMFEGVRNSATGVHTVPTDPHPAQYQPPPVSQPWKSDICDCFDDMNSCCITFFCPCITFGQVAEIVDKGYISCGISATLYTLIYCLTGCACIYSCWYRTKLRHQYKLEEKPCYDCLVHLFCESCALCQEYRELQSRGFNMAIGWTGNMVERSYEMVGAAVPPSMERGMSRV